MRKIFLFFNFLFYLPLFICQLCGMNPPRDQTDCFNYQSNATDCCYLYNQTDSLCLEIQNPNVLSPGSNYTYNNQQYQVNCNLKTFFGQIGTSCGKQNPQNLTDCSNFSTSSNYCCYYNTATTSYCFWIGQEFTSGIFSFNATSNYNVICKSERLKLYTYQVLILFAFMFIF